MLCSIIAVTAVGDMIEIFLLLEIVEALRLYTELAGFNLYLYNRLPHLLQKDKRKKVLMKKKNSTRSDSKIKL